MDECKGHLVLLMAPSGSGKKMLVDALEAKQTDQMYFAKTFTSRARREGTEENPRYVFVSLEEFQAMIETDEFVEWANFGGNLYGTSKTDVLDALKEKQIVFKEMELQGVEQMKKIVPEDHMTVIYIDAGDWSQLEARVLARAEIDPTELALRKERYVEESKFKDKADIIVRNHNGEGDKAMLDFRNIISGIIESIQ